MGALAAIAAAGVATSAGGMIANASSGGSSSQIPNTYQPQNQYAQDTSYQNTLYGDILPYAGMSTQLIPGYQQYAGNIQNNPYAGQAQQGANSAASFGQPIGMGQINAAGSLNGAGNSIMQSAFDPQQALYAQLANQNNQSSNVANAQAGVKGPYAAGVINQSANDFNLQWQNAQLARQSQGAQAAGQAYSGAGALGNAGMQTLQQSANMPYSTYLGQQGDYLNALNSQSAGATNALGVPQQALQDIQSYLGLGQSASDIGRLNAQGVFAQNQQLGQNLGSSLNSLAGMYANNNSPMAGYGTPMPGVSGGYTNINPQTFDYSGGGAGVDYMAA